jgi:DNA-binding Xre family transcriptional regulator
LQGREWTVKDLAEELGLSTPRVHGLLKEHNEDIKAIFASRGITPKPADKGPKARLFDYKGKQWTVKQLAKEFGLSNVRFNNLIKEFNGDIEKIALTRSKSKKTTETKKEPNTEKAYEENLANLVDKKREELEIKLHLDDEVFVVKEKSSEQLLDTMKNYIKKIHQEDKNLGAAEGFLIFNDLNEENHLLGIELINEDSAEFNYTFDIYSVDFHKLINDIIGEVGDYLLAANNAVIANDDSAMLKIFDRILGHKKIISIKNEVVLGIRHPNFNNIEEEEYTEIAIDYDDPLNSILDSQNWDSLSYLRPDAVMSSLQFGFKDSVENTVTCYDFDLEEEELDHFDKDVFSSLISSKDINPTLLGVEHSCGSTITEIAKSKFIFEWEE